MRGKCATGGREVEFPRASAQCCLTFPHGVYSALWLSSRSFSSLTRCTGFADSPPVDYVIAEAQYYHRELLTPLRFCFMVILPCSLLSGTNFVELCNIFEYCGANYFSSLSTLSWLEFITFRQGRGISLNSAIFLLQSQLLPPRHECGSLTWESGLITKWLAEFLDGFDENYYFSPIFL